MLIGRVVGNVVSSTKTEKLGGTKMLIVVPINIKTLEEKNDYQICVDDIGAGVGDIVMCAYGSSARQTNTTKNTASDYSIHAIVDYITLENMSKYKKENDDYFTKKETSDAVSKGSGNTGKHKKIR